MSHPDEGPLLRLFSPRLGGPVGERARPSGFWFAPAGWVIGVGTLCWLVLVLRQAPCRQHQVGQPVNAYYRLCYSDIPLVFQAGDLAHGGPVTAQTQASPVVLAVIALARLLANLVGADVGPRVSDQQALDASWIFFAVTGVVLWFVFVVLLAVHLRLAGQDAARSWDVLMIAAAPAVLTAGLVSWDLVAAALTSLALLLWARRRPGSAGVALGLAVGTRFYPLVVVVALGVLCARVRRWEAFRRLTGATVLTWLVVNLPVAVLHWGSWTSYLASSVGRPGASYGSVWYVLELAGIRIGPLALLVPLLWLAAVVSVAVFVLRVPRRPRVGQVAFVLLAAVVTLSHVYSPQNVLWLLPLLVLARPRWLDWAVFSVAELGYYAAIWGHLAGTLGPGSSAQGLYGAAVIVRVLALAWVAGRVVRDMLYPQHDPVREPGVDDPLAGELVPRLGNTGPPAPTPAGT